MYCACKGCNKRHVGCHSECPDYIEYQKSIEEYRKTRYQNKLKAQALDEVSNRGKRRMFKSDRGHRLR